MPTKTWVCFYTYGLCNIKFLEIFNNRYSPKSNLLPFNSDVSAESMNTWSFCEAYRSKDDSSTQIVILKKKWSLLLAFWYEELFITNSKIYELKNIPSLRGIGIFVIDSLYFQAINALWGILEYMTTPNQIARCKNYHSLFTYKELKEDGITFNEKNIYNTLLAGPISLVNGSTQSPHNFSIMNPDDVFGSTKITIWKFCYTSPTENELKVLHFSTKEEYEKYKKTNLSDIDEVQRCDILTTQKNIIFQKDLNGKDICPNQIFMKYGKWNTCLYTDM